MTLVAHARACVASAPHSRGCDLTHHCVLLLVTRTVCLFLPQSEGEFFDDSAESGSIEMSGGGSIGSGDGSDDFF